MSSAICFNLDQSKILSSGNGLTLFQTRHCFYLSALQILEKAVGKGEIALNEQFLLFSAFFILLKKSMSNKYKQHSTCRVFRAIENYSDK